ncbi:unnamed protein product [Lota lota]
MKKGLKSGLPPSKWMTNPTPMEGLFPMASIKGIAMPLPPSERIRQEELSVILEPRSVVLVVPGVSGALVHGDLAGAGQTG